jgi:peroxiredoxin/outer membrane lipoprotein-sorting protein
MRYHKILIAVCLCLSAAFSTSSAAGEDTEKLLQRVEETYTALDDYYFAGTFTVLTEVMGMTQAIDAPFVMAGSRPGKTRMSIDHKAFGSLVVSDGEATWSYMRAFNQYKYKTAVPLGPGSAGRGEGAGGGPLPTTAGSFIMFYTVFGDDHISTQRVGTETIAFAGREADCAVIELTYTMPDTSETIMGPDTLWIDPEDAMVLRSVHVVSMATEEMAVKTQMRLRYEEIRIGTQPPDSLFVFTPPEGATQVEEFAMGQGGVDLTGTAAADFSLSGLGGKTYRLEQLEGSVVLIDFWATWCPPCREELPIVEKLYRELGGRGLVVLAVTNEPKNVAEAFIEKNGYTFPVLIDKEQSVFGEYSVTSIPVVVVIDRDGKIAAHFIGRRSESKLRQALERAGIK